MIVQNQRPGVYTRYDVASAYAAPTSLKYAVVVAKAEGGEPDRLYSFTGYSDACEVFPPDGEGMVMRACIGLLFESGVSRVLAVPVEDDYETAFNALETAENIGAIISDATNPDDLAAMKARVTASCEEGRECVAFCGISDAASAIAAARELNCERVVLTCPAVSNSTDTCRSAVLAAAALGGAILASGDAAKNWNGESFNLIKNPEALPEATIQALLEAGVTVFESVGGEVECIRALTTRTTTNGVLDRSFSGVNSMLIIDDVMQSVRSTLKLRLRGGRISGSPIESIRSQVTVVLSEKQSDGLIEGFAPPRCYASSYDPDICIVELSFAVAHVVSQIHVTAHIQV